MKKILARFLVLLMLLTSVVIPADKENSSRAAEKGPTMNASDSIEKIKLLTKNGVAQEVGKTVTLASKNVKKGNIKDMTVFVDDPSVATVTKKVITKKKSGFKIKIKIKKPGVAFLSVRITLKKKQAGIKRWISQIQVTGVKKMAPKELAALPDKYIKANMRSTLLNKYGNYIVHAKEYDESGKPLSKIDIFQTKEDIYTRNEDLEYNNVRHSYTATNMGYMITDENGTLSSYYFCHPYPDYNLNLPISDDPEKRRELKETTDIEYGYTDGNYYYFSDVTNSKAEVWERTENIINAKTYEFVLVEHYLKNEKGKIYKYASHSLKLGVDEPDLYQTTKYLYTAEGKKKVKIESIVDPGTSEEQRISMEIPQGEPIKFGGLDGYNIYTDAEGTTPISKERDTTHDYTVYYIKESVAPFTYKHNPMDNPKAAADLIRDPNAVYGYVPNPESKRLGAFASFDWSDPAVVADLRKQREDYHKGVAELEEIVIAMKKEGKTAEEIAKVVSPRRNEIRMEAYKDNPEGLKKLKESNLETYGNENGPTLEWLINKYKTWDVVLEKAMSMNAAADALLGLYDMYYDTYLA